MDGNFLGDIMVKFKIIIIKKIILLNMKSSNMENTNNSCEQACQNNSTCVGWVYHQLNKTCNLFNKLDKLFVFDGTYFGIKNCTAQLFNQLLSGITDYIL